jgi:integrase
MERGNIDTAGASNTVRGILDAYLVACEGRLAENTFDIRLRACRRFSQRHGGLLISQVKPFHANESCDAEWANGSRRLYLISLKAGFNWAVKEGLIPSNPLRSVVLPTDTTSSRERTLQPGDWQTIMGKLAQRRHVCLRRLVIALKGTGARPGELTNARVADWNDDIGAIVYYRDAARRSGEHRHKTGKTKDRIIYFPTELIGMVRAHIADKSPTDWLFPTRAGTRYSRATLTSCFRRIRERTGFDWLVPYTFRHGFATERILAGQSLVLQRGFRLCIYAAASCGTGLPCSLRRW